MIGKEVPVAIERHGDAGMPHDRLQPLWRPAQVRNKQARSGMAKGVERVFRLPARQAPMVDFAGINADPVVELQGNPAGASNREVAFNVTPFAWKYQLAGAFGFRLLQGIGDDRRKRNITAAGLAFRFADFYPNCRLAGAHEWLPPRDQHRTSAVRAIRSRACR